MANGRDGRAVVVEIDGVAVAGQTGLTESNSRNMIEVTSKPDDHTDWVYGVQDTTVSLEALHVDGDAGQAAIEDATDNKEVVTLKRVVDGTDIEEASALVSSIEKSDPRNDASTFNAEFQLKERWSAVA